ncbi:MAG: hypothetical protein AAFU73_07960 [Planctomycetota bacterium]
MTRNSLLLAALSVGLSAGAYAQGANNCGSAQPISGEGTFSTDTTSATQDGPGNCAQGFAPDVWFSWTAPATDDYDFSTCSFADYDTALAAYSGSCGSLSLITCNDDSGCANYRSTITISAMAGQSYLIQVGGWNGNVGVADLVIEESSSGGGGGGGCANPTSGPDVIVGEIPNISNYGAVGGIAGYSLGTTSCNTGDAELLWIASTNDHPVIGQNIYRLENGRFEQIGISWLKHGFTALQQGLCCTCNSSGTGTRLGVGCSDPYGSGLNGSQGGLGPRNQVNAYTGFFLYPYQAQGQGGNRAYKRIQVQNSDVNPALHPSAEYFGEAQYIAPDDAAAGNGTNNVSWCRLNRTGGTGSGGSFSLSIGGGTVREEPAIRAWEDNEPGVSIVEVNVAGEGQFVAGYNVIDNGDGTWNYEYAIFNNNSDLSGQSFSVPVGANVNVTNVGMSFPMYHSGEPYTNIAWSSNVSANAVTWETEAYAQNQNANALRWGTMYSFWFTADAAPEGKTATLGLFKPGGPGDQSLAVDGPADGSNPGAQISYFCPANINSTGQPSSFTITNVDLTARTMDMNVVSLPPNQFGIFVASQTSGFVPNLGGGFGNLCVVGNIGRFVGGGIFNSGPAGQVSAVADLDLMPTPTAFVQVMSGETWFLQWWHRDFILSATSNLSNAAEVQFP